ncbi:MAG: glycerol-3-phosphate 1-O-acyltransferase PlsY [Thermodesulfovibrionales bacterium]
MKIVPLIIFAFIIGSIPFGVIIARVKGIDLRKVGSGNIGATNVLRALGRGPAVLTLFGDILKGTLSVAIGRYLSVGPVYEGVMGLSAILGHNFSLFLGLRGGKGVATSIGVLLLYSPMAALITVILWLVAVFITRYSSLGALISFGLLPINIYLFDYTKEKLIVGGAITALLILRHAVNIKRLVKGIEPRIGERA